MSDRDPWVFGVVDGVGYIFDRTSGTAIASTRGLESYTRGDFGPIRGVCARACREWHREQEERRAGELAAEQTGPDEPDDTE